MKDRRLGRTGLRVPEIGLGTMTFGTMADEGQSLAILDKAFDAGLYFIDLAEVYPVPPDPQWATRTEQIVGKWMQGRRRDSLLLATKVAGPSGGWFQAPVRNGHTALDRHSIARACEDSLRRLGTDYIDLYQTHWPDPGLPYEETMEALTRLVEDGKVRAVGCSNESAYGLTKSLWISDKHGFARHETIQNNFSLLESPLRRRAGRRVSPRAGEPARLQPPRRRRALRQVPGRRVADSPRVSPGTASIRRARR